MKFFSSFPGSVVANGRRGTTLLHLRNGKRSRALQHLSGINGRVKKIKLNFKLIAIFMSTFKSEGSGFEVFLFLPEMRGGIEFRCQRTEFAVFFSCSVAHSLFFLSAMSGRLDMALDDIAKAEKKSRPARGGRSDGRGGRDGGRPERRESGGSKPRSGDRMEGRKSLGGGRGGPERRRGQGGANRGRRNPYSRVHPPPAQNSRQ